MARYRSISPAVALLDLAFILLGNIHARNSSYLRSRNTDFVRIHECDHFVEMDTPGSPYRNDGPMMKSNDELSVYLKDHFAGGVGAIELLRHLSESHEDRDLKAFYRELLADIEADHETLNRLMTELGIEESKVRNAGAWVAEKLSRVKLGSGTEFKGQLNDLQALETLFMGITGKRLLWCVLSELHEANTLPVEVNLGELEQRALQQLERVEAKRLQLAESLFGISSR